MKIYFCEKCGVSIPLQEVVGGRATARDGKTYCQNCRPPESAAGEDLRLYFCDNCRVSIPLQDVITSSARVEGEKMLCPDCARLGVREREARKESIREEMKEEEESRYRLHFCDRCNTSVPQSHLITGRAVVRGGRTYCERCKTKAGSRRRGVLGAVVAVVVIAAAVAGGWFLFGRGDLLAGASARDSRLQEAALRADILEEVERIGADRERRMDARFSELSKLVDDLAVEGRTLGESFGELKRTADESLRNGAALRSEIEARLDRADASLRDALDRLAVLAARLEELRDREPLPAPVRPRPPQPPSGEPEEPSGEPGEPAAGGPSPQPEPEASPEVKQWISQLENEDAGVRFAAAVELGKSGYAGASEPLGKALAKDKDTFVRRAAARSLGELNAWSAVPVLIDTLEDKEYFVAVTAHKALIAITGQDFGFQDQLSRTQVRKVAAKAREWWEEHKDDRK